MSRFVDIKLLGDRQLQKKLNRLENKVQSKVMRDATKKALVPVLALAQQRAPVKTGRLKASLKIVVARGRRTLGAIVKTGSRAKLGIDAGDPYYYPAALEYGTNKLQATAFLRSSLADRRKAALNILTSEIRQMLLRTK